MSVSPGTEASLVDILALRPAIAAVEEASGIYAQKVRHRPVSAELVYLPFVLFRYRLAATSLLGRRREEMGAVLVDLNGAVPINIKKGTRLSGPGMEGFAGALQADRGGRKPSGPPLAIEARHVPASAVAPAHLPVDDAIRDGLRILRYEVFRLFGALRHRKLEVRAEEPHLVVHHPYWIFYSIKRGGERTFDVLDALNGVKEGGQIIRSVARALFGAPDPRGKARA